MGEIETFDFTPDPISLLESNRNLGYSIEEAISDLIDNSISAGATKISYELHWNDGKPYFLLKDNGSGMSNVDNELVNSFRLGSKNPLEERDPKDLGRFGFGMKTASLSQARVLTVITKKKDFATLGLSLDLNFIRDQKGKWLLKSADEKLCANELNFLDNIESGTIVRWDDWDRSPKDEILFNALTLKIQNYVGLCFHRFIEKGIVIMSRESPIPPCSPIPPGSRERSKTPLKKTNAQQLAYLIPHPSVWREDYELKPAYQFNSFRLFEGFERQQGIYIYRCDRLLTPKAGWFGLLNKANGAKLARVVIDYPNDADAYWSLDITKTNAEIPYEFKNAIQQLIKVAREESRKKINRGDGAIREKLPHTYSKIWKISKDKIDIQKQHTFFEHYLREKKIAKKDLFILLDYISDTLPLTELIATYENDPSQYDRMETRNDLDNEALGQIKKLFDFQCTITTKKAAFIRLVQDEPFCYHKEQLKKYLQIKS